MEKQMVETVDIESEPGFNENNLWTEQLTQELAWVKFWQTPWLVAHSSWLGSEALSVNAAEIAVISQRCPRLLRQKLQLSECFPPKPEPTLLNFVCCDFSARMHVLLLATEVVKPGFALAENEIDAPTREWCRRLAKAIRPGKWAITQAYSQPLSYLSGCLLKQWVPRDMWPRLKLLFNRQWIEQVESISIPNHGVAKTPAAKLHQLWQAVIWRAELDLDKGA
ncbi:MAG: hypothetical protein P8Y45_18605 [Exilibacterium sp.]